MVTAAVVFPLVVGAYQSNEGYADIQRRSLGAPSFHDLAVS